ncbi:LAGLIDADG family homing endonuclease [Frigoribacterium sp. UYMn621]|uniref:LAGLIDADG family homing endonuclease n=1 Tax=Frigoribacterium sp. UYMn621 TaxID=3156343 RepID=UPI00339B55DE
MTTEKILPNQGTDERGWISNEQEAAIVRACWEMHSDNPAATHSVVNGSNMDTGKLGAYSELILTPKGWTTYEKIQTGDFTVGSDGLPTLVEATFEQGLRSIYRVTFSDGSFTDVGAEHLWSVNTPTRKATGKPYRTLTTQQIQEEGLTYANGNRKHFIPMVQPVEFEQRGEITLDPYTVGALLGDGSLGVKGGTTITTDKEIAEAMFLPVGASIRQLDTGGKYKADYVGAYSLSGMKCYLKELGMCELSADKHVPDEYLWTSAANRVAVLQGLLDTDGTPANAEQKSSGIEYGTVSKQLAEDVQFLVRSLGGVASIRCVEEPGYTYNGEKLIGQPFYRMYLALPHGVPPFRLGRKAARATAPTKYAPTRSIESIEFDRVELAKCIRVAASDHLYVTRDFIVTHNTLQATEVVVRMGFERVLYIGIKDTYHQWADRLSAQSDGALELRRIDATKAGRLAWDDAYAGKPGQYFVGAQFLTAQDWTARQIMDTNGHKLWKEDENGERILRHGEPVPVTEQHHLQIFKRARIQAHPFDLVIFDEVHVVSNRKSVGRKTLVTIPTHNKLAMSGTWWANKFEGAWSITKWVWPELIDSSFQRWSEMWCSSEPVLKAGGEQMVSARGRDIIKLKGERNPGEFVKSLPCYIRLDGELEVPEPEIVYVDLLPEQRADYEDLERDMMVWLETPAGQRATLIADLPITLRTRLRTATLGVMSLDDETGQVFFADDTRSTKLHALRGIVDREDWRGQQVGIYCDSKQFVKVTVKRMRAMGYDAVEWSGDVSSKAREEIKRKFLAGEIQYLVSVIASFSTGLDLFQTVCGRVCWLNESDDNSRNQQAIKRYFRSGRKEGFQHLKIVARESYDEGILSRNVMGTLAMHASLTVAA